ncbi:MAG TPA: amino acid ABC transporter permease [Reyranella sp.]|nr:amino acid ABC transporter permease [Reyranella sp.]
MSYVFQFGAVWQEWDKLLLGTWLTVRLSAITMVLGLGVGILGAVGKNSRHKAVRWLVQGYVEAIRNTPFLVQLLLVYLGLPSVGVRLSPEQAALLAMVVNLGAYATEIVRAGIEAVPRGQIEAGRALGLKPHQIFRFVVLVPALHTVFPALASQFILVMLASSVVSVISAEELTAVTDTIVARNFRSFEFYFVITGIYLGLTLTFQAVFALIERALFHRWAGTA